MNESNDKKEALTSREIMKEESMEVLNRIDWEKIRDLARELGYMIAMHGSLERDIDLIACPWVEDAKRPHDLALAICNEVNGFIDKKTNPTVKPHGRLAFAINFVGMHTYLDLSVMPRIRRNQDD